MEYPGKALQARLGVEPPAPRIYYLHGAVAADAERRKAHLARVGGLGFDWICWAGAGAAAFGRSAAPGAGASLNDPDGLTALIAEAGGAGLKVMVETAALAPGELGRLLDLGLHGLMSEAAGRRRAADWGAVLTELRARRQPPVIVADAYRTRPGSAGHLSPCHLAVADRQERADCQSGAIGASFSACMGSSWGILA